MGAHYYVFGAESTAYTEAFVNVKLPTELNITSGSDKRHAFFGLGVRGSQKGIDFGITYQGNGWMPCFNDPYKGISGDSSVTGGAVYTGCVAPSTATNAIMVVKPVSTTLVEFYVRFTDADNNTVGDTFWMQIPVAEGNLTAAANGRFNCTFFRFASLVPDIGVPDDQTDGSYMRGGRFTGCQLYNGTSYVAWGIGNSTVVQAWKVSPERITVTYSGTTDIVDINHWST